MNNNAFSRRAVHVSKFLSSNVQVLSGSDDNTVKVWDIPTEKDLVTYTDHTVSIIILLFYLNIGLTQPEATLKECLLVVMGPKIARGGYFVYFFMPPPPHSNRGAFRFVHVCLSICLKMSCPTGTFLVLSFLHVLF